MGIDLNAEQLIDLTKASKLLPIINGKRVSTNAIWRWCRKGIQGTQLEYVRVGRRIFTSAQALNRFTNALAAADRKYAEEVSDTYSTRRRRRPASQLATERRLRYEQAVRELEEAGL